MDTNGRSLAAGTEPGGSLPHRFSVYSRPFVGLISISWPSAFFVYRVPTESAC